ncbi:MAG: hypothetical protein QGF59_04225, partial [Pirellulaceae bacterium]|nr:hypothetical protein [Pirellulaceae bacterium]
MSAKISSTPFIKRTGVTVENEPIIKSDGAGSVTQWDNSNQDAGEGIYFVEGGSAGDPLRLGVGVAAPSTNLHISSANGTAAKMRISQVGQNNYDIGMDASSNQLKIQDDGVDRLTIS